MQNSKDGGKALLWLSLLVVIILFNLSSCHKADRITPLEEKWEKVIPQQEIPLGLKSLSAEECGLCHVQHYEEWKHSTHALAWSDQQFQAEIKKKSSPFMCINCHIPLQNQQEYIVEGVINGDVYRPVKKVNPLFDKKLQDEAITCAVCHVRDGAIIGLLGTNIAPHKTRQDSAFLSEQLCIDCHNAVAVISPTVVCSFETGDEWKKGPYRTEKNCIACHMPTERRELVKGLGHKFGHYHNFPGSGIPKVDTIEQKGLNGLGIYPSGLNKSYLRGDSISFELTLVNEFAGHRLPTGDPERFYIISFELKDHLKQLVSKKDYRIGEKWQWHPVAKKISDNNLYPKEKRRFRFDFKAIHQGEYHLTIGISKHRMDKKSAEYNKMDSHYPLSILIFEQEYSTIVK